MVDFGPQAPINTTTVATAVQRRWACLTRKMWPADRYERQRCNVVPLHVCSVVYLWYICPVGCVLVREGTKTDYFYRYVSTRYKIGVIHRHPGNRLIHSQRKKTLAARHGNYSARLDLKPQPQVPDGLPVST